MPLRPVCERRIARAPLEPGLRGHAVRVYGSAYPCTLRRYLRWRAGLCGRRVQDDFGKGHVCVSLMGGAISKFPGSRFCGLVPFLRRRQPADAVGEAAQEVEAVFVGGGAECWVRDEAHDGPGVIAFPLDGYETVYGVVGAAVGGSHRSPDAACRVEVTANQHFIGVFGWMIEKLEYDLPAPRICPVVAVFGPRAADTVGTVLSRSGVAGDKEGAVERIFGLIERDGELAALVPGFVPDPRVADAAAGDRLVQPGVAKV